jgi:hypothetical protein
VTVESILSQYEPKISTLGFELRAFLLSALKDIQEEAESSPNIIGYSYGKGYSNLICTIIPSKKGIKLGFYKGIELPDPEKLLTGSGKVHKFVEIKSKSDINNPALLNLLKEAVKLHHARIH